MQVYIASSAIEEEYTLEDTKGMEPDSLGSLLSECVFDLVHMIGVVVYCFFFRLKSRQMKSSKAPSTVTATATANTSDVQMHTTSTSREQS
jgi:hypothetical protein